MTSSRAVLTATLGNFAAPLAGFISAPILARALGVDGRGEVAAATAPVLLAIVALTMGLPEALTYYVSRGIFHSARATREALTFVSVIGLIATVLIWLVAPLIAIGNRDITSLIQVATLFIVPNLLNSVIRGFASGRQEWALIAWERFIGSFVRLLLILIAIIIGVLNPTTAVISIGVGGFVGAVAYIRLLSRTKRPVTDKYLPRAPIYSYGSRIWIGSLAGILLSRIDQTLMVGLSTIDQLGLYAIAVTVAELILVFNSAVRDVIFSFESQNVDSERLGQASRVSSLVTLLLAVVVALLAHQGIPLLFGRNFEEAVVPTYILLAAIALGNPGSVAGAGISARGKPELRSFSLIVAVCFNVATVYLLVPDFGAIGAALATLIGSTVAGWVNILILRIRFQIPISTFVGIRKADLMFLSTEVSRKIRNRT